MTATAQTEIARYAEAIYAGWHREDTVCYTDSLGRLQHYPSRQTILYLPGNPGFFRGAGASSMAWIDYDSAAECRAAAKALRAKVLAALSLDEAGRIVAEFYAEA